jgi:hypothetical protein
MKQRYQVVQLGRYKLAMDNSDVLLRAEALLQGFQDLRLKYGLKSSSENKVLVWESFALISSGAHRR